MEDRRRQNRTILHNNFLIRERDSGRPLGRIVNLSRYGFLVVSDEPVAESRRYWLTLALTDAVGRRRMLNVEAQAIWCRRMESSGEFGSGFELGGIGAADDEVLARIVAAEDEMPASGVARAGAG